MATPPGIKVSGVGLQQLQEALRLGLAVVTELWSYSTMDWVTSVHAADIDGDGDVEVLVGSRDGSVSALTRKGLLKWKRTERNGEWIGAVYCINNVDAVDRTRVVVGARNNTVTALDETGQWLWQYNTGQVVRRIRVSDINNDGKSEVVVGSEDCFVHVLSCATGELLWKYETNGWIRSVFSIDLDRDGEIETLIASGDKHLYTLDSKGQLKWKYDARSKIHAVYAADLDNDGEVEILVGSDAKDLYAMTPDRQKKWQFSPKNRIHSINVADLNNDGHLEVIAGSEDEHIYFLNDKGNLLWKHFLGRRIFSINAVDLNRDGIWEILVGAEDNQIHVLRIELSEGLLTKIINSHRALGQPHSSVLELSPTERTLLRDLADEAMPHEQGLMKVHVEQLLAHHDYLAALSALLQLDQQRIQLLWMRDAGHIRTISTIVGTPDREIVVGTDEGDIKAFDISGNLLWSRSSNERIRSLEVADIDQDGMVEIIVGSTDGHVYALSREGQETKWQKQFNDWVESICITVSLSSDATEIVFCSADNKIHVYTSSFLQLVEPIITPQSIQIVQTHDLDGDGIQEIIAGTIDDKVYAYTREGKELWTFETLDRVNTICIKDIDNDGHVEILVGSEDRNIYVLDHTGHLKWRYYTPHRVLDVNAIDADHDGQIEVFVGVGNGRLYVLNSVGDELWQFEANDRIRVVQAADINKDGVIEILLGSEDRMYLLQMIDREQLRERIEHCWQMLLKHRPPKEVLYNLIEQPDAKLRAFALTKLASLPNFVERDIWLIEKLLIDDSFEVKKALVTSIVALYRSSSQKGRAFLESLSQDQQHDIRLAFIDSLPALCAINSQLGFEYLERFTRNVSEWIRRSVVRKLDQLIPSFPQQVFDILLNTIGDEREWIRQESARVMAHYFDVHTDNLLKGVRLLTTKELEPSLFQLVTYCASTPIVQNIFGVFVGLLVDLKEVNILDRLKNTVDALEGSQSLLCGEGIYKIYHELYRLHRKRTIDEIAKYKCMLGKSYLLDEKDELHFDDTISVLHQLNTVTVILRRYLRREGLGDRISSLLEATTAINTILVDLEHTYFTWSKRREHLLDYKTLKLLLVGWRAIVSAELGRVRGKAELCPELQTKKVQQEEYIGILLSVPNKGRSPADHVKITLKQDGTFTLIGRNEQVFETIPTHEPVLAEFTIKPRKPSLHLTFNIIYDDAEAKGKVMKFGDRLDLVGEKREFQRIKNPYYTGTPIQDQSMFYGREEELALLQEVFVHSSANTVVVLYGQRRSGKSSLLFKLVQTSILKPHIPIRIDMQHETLSFSTSKFLHNIAYYIHRALRKEDIFVQLPQKAMFEEDATFALDVFLDDVEAVLGERKLVILIDEFEILEDKVTKHELDQEIFVYLRSLMQDRQGIHFLLAGTHTIKELTEEYWSVFFNIANHRRLSKLSEEAAQQLISRPVAEVLEYDPFAIEKIRYLTGDQPYLIQLICHSIVRHCNAHRKNYVTINDVNIVQEEVMETGNVYFNWIWDQASKEGRFILAIMAQEGGEDGHYISLIDIERLYQDYSLPYKRENALQALRNLRDGDMIVEVPRENRFKISIGLTRIWLREVKPLQRVILEENLLD